MYRRRGRDLEVFLVHPGGPYWTRKDAGAWTVPKGEYGDDEHPLEAAKREFQEETGFAVGSDFHELGVVRQAGGKLVTAWAFEGDCDPQKLTSNLFQMEWPQHSDRMIVVPEVDRGEWFSISAARQRILKSQEPFLDMLSLKVGSLA
jgi:predicted NUDIX family NTP pyrophosphohydrolase